MLNYEMVVAFSFQDFLIFNFRVGKMNDEDKKGNSEKKIGGKKKSGERNFKESKRGYHEIRHCLEFGDSPSIERTVTPSSPSKLKRLQ